jgi:hypothetical protein
MSCRGPVCRRSRSTTAASSTGSCANPKRTRRWRCVCDVIPACLLRTPPSRVVQASGLTGARAGRETGRTRHGAASRPAHEHRELHVSSGGGGGGLQAAVRLRVAALSLARAPPRQAALQRDRSAADCRAGGVRREQACAPRRHASPAVRLTATSLVTLRAVDFDEHGPPQLGGRAPTAADRSDEGLSRHDSAGSTREHAPARVRARATSGVLRGASSQWHPPRRSWLRCARTNWSWPSRGRRRRDCPSRSACRSGGARPPWRAAARCAGRTG